MLELIDAGMFFGTLLVLCAVALVAMVFRGGSKRSRGDEGEVEVSAGVAEVSAGDLCEHELARVMVAFFRAKDLVDEPSGFGMVEPHMIAAGDRIIFVPFDPDADPIDYKAGFHGDAGRQELGTWLRVVPL